MKSGKLLGNIIIEEYPEPVVALGHIDNEYVKIIRIDRSREATEKLTRVVYLNDENKKLTVFIPVE